MSKELAEQLQNELKRAKEKSSDYSLSEEQKIDFRRRADEAIDAAKGRGEDIRFSYDIMHLQDFLNTNHLG